MESYLLLVDALEAPTTDLASELRRGGSVVRIARDMDGAADLLRRAPPALMVLRAGDVTAIDLCRALRTLSDRPIVVVCASHSKALAIQCLEAGADSVFPELPPRREFAARIDALLRSRTAAHRVTSRRDVYCAADLVVNAHARVVTKGGRRLSLTRTEFRLLAALARRAGRLVSVADLLTEVWGDTGPVCSDNLRLYIRRLRQKLEDDHRQPRLILNQRRVGYRLQGPLLVTKEKIW